MYMERYANKDRKVTRYNKTEATRVAQAKRVDC